MLGEARSARTTKRLEPWEAARQPSHRSRGVASYWLWLVGAACIVLIVLAIVVLPKVNRTRTTAVTDAASKRTVREHALKRDREMEALVNSEAEARRLMARYARAAVVDDVLHLLRDGNKMEPLLRAAGHHAKADYDWSPDPDAKLISSAIGGRPYACLSGRFADQSRYNVFFIRDGDRLCIDWKATVGYGTASFEALGQGQGDAGEIRGKLVPDLYYNTTYPEGEFQSYRLEAPDGKESIWCYVHLNSRIAEKVAHLFVGGDLIHRQAGSAFVTVALTRINEGEMPNQWLIERLLHEEWVEP